ncbi:hypothetical protein ULG90_16755 [Halopseudomonas pachastrellae]|nr:hypothetical protein ULG90_16755 [Halopseudomonas pachastrellae]
MLSQLPKLFGLAGWPDNPGTLVAQWQRSNTLVLVMGGLALGWLLYARHGLSAHLQRLGLATGLAALLAKLRHCWWWYWACWLPGVPIWRLRGCRWWALFRRACGAGVANGRMSPACARSCCRRC